MEIQAFGDNVSPFTLTSIKAVVDELGIHSF